MALHANGGFDLSLFLLRLLVAGIFLWHGVPKAFDWGMATEKFIGFGLPGFFGPLVGVVEVVAGTLLAVGFLPRVSAAVLGVVILGALATVQVPGGITAGLERDSLILVSILVLLTAGPGAFTLSRSR